jgi:hypothetical protein
MMAIALSVYSYE